MLNRKGWADLTDGQKIDRIADAVENLSRQANNLSNNTSSLGGAISGDFTALERRVKKLEDASGAINGGNF